MSMRYPAGFISAFYNPLKNPDAPTIGTASPASTTSLSIAFTAPANVGGSAITSYIATAKRTSDGVLFTASGASSPISVTGLTAVAFTVTVVAVNSYGPSAPSAASNSVTPAMQVGDSFGGGFFAGQIGVSGVATHNLVIGPVATAQSTALAWKIINTGGDPTSVINGPANSATMNNATYPAAQFCEALSIGGFTDWYMPAKNELEVCYFNLKPSTTVNDTASGTNTNAVPSRGSNYTSGTPAQTSATDFRNTGTQLFSGQGYWASTQASATQGSVQAFGQGTQYAYNKDRSVSYKVRAVRRVAV